MLFVDRLKRYKRQSYCHCVSDVSIKDLHEQMANLDVARRWFHKDHYDLHPENFEKVREHVETVSTREIVRIRRKIAGR